MAGNLQPLYNNLPIVDADGKPTEYFIRWAQQRQIDITAGITAAQALEIIQQFTADHPLISGSGITLTPSGNIADDVTIAAEVQAILDQISTTQGSILYRGAADWAALAPGTAGQVLQTGGAAANPSWVAAGGSSFRGALAYRSGSLTAQNYTAGFTAVPLDAEDYDTDSLHSNTVNNTRMTVPVGVTKVRLDGQVQVTNMSATGYLQAAILKNGATGYPGGAVGTTGDSSNATPRCNINSPPLTVVAGDYFEIGVNVGNDTSVDVVTNGSTFLAMEIIG